MKVTFLGTGTSQGVPVIACNCEVCASVDFRDKRLRTSIHIETEGLSLVIDSGPDFRQQMLRERIHKLDALIFTHEHKDHTAGMDDVRAFNFKEMMDMPVYAHQRVIDQLKQEFSYIFTNKAYPGVPRIKTYAIDNEPFTIENTTLIPIEVMHYKLPVFGYRIKDFTYITDANYISAEEMKKIKGTKVLVMNALQQEDHISHFKLSQAIDLIREINPERAYLTHISHRMGLHHKINKTLPENISLAFDGLKITAE